MVICQYFLNNSCRFGNKCHNEHVNVKLTLKTDAESSLIGKQWPLSCYGPFRDKPCVPNFIEDQSFEEVRQLCYEAKATGNVQMVTNQFTQSVLNATNKMNMIVNPTDDVIILAANLYNSNCTTTPAQNVTANPFGMASNSMNANNNSMFGGSGGGGGGGGTGSSNGNTNLFGSSSAAVSNPFTRNAAGFGAPAQNQPSNLFGGSSATPNSMNLFGAPPNAAPNHNTPLLANPFGGSSFSPATNSSGFGSASQPPSMFGGSSASGPFSQQPATATPFASTNQPASLFGQQAQQSNPVFGGNATFGNQVKTGMFNQANPSIGQSSNTGNIFGQSVPNSMFGGSTQANPFGSAPPNQAQSIFGGSQQQQQSMQSADNPFAAVAQASTTNIFGGAQMQQPQLQQPQLQQPQLQQPQQPFQSSTNAFGTASGMNMSQSFFGSNQVQNPNQMNAVPAPAPTMQQQQQQQNVFASSPFSAPPAPAQAPFGGAMFQNQQDPQKPPIQPLFGGQAHQANAFGAQPPPPSKTLYTPMDLLDPDELEAFQSNTFDISKIPTKPPPMELCI